MQIINGSWNRFCNWVSPRASHMDKNVEIVDQIPHNTQCAGCKKPFAHLFTRAICFKSPLENNQPQPQGDPSSGAVLPAPQANEYYEGFCLARIPFSISTNSFEEDSKPYIISLIASCALFVFIRYKTRNVSFLESYASNSIASCYWEITASLVWFLAKAIIHQKNQVLRVKNDRRMVPASFLTSYEKGTNIAPFYPGIDKAALGSRASFDMKNRNFRDGVIITTDALNPGQNPITKMRVLAHLVLTHPNDPHFFVHSDLDSPTSTCPCGIPVDLRNTPDYIASRNRKIGKIALHGLFNLVITYLVYRLFPDDRAGSIPIRFKCFGKEISTSISMASIMISLLFTSLTSMVHQIIRAFLEAQVSPLLPLISPTYVSNENLQLERDKLLQPNILIEEQ